MHIAAFFALAALAVSPPKTHHEAKPTAESCTDSSMLSLERRVWNGYHTSNRSVLDTLMAQTFVNVDPGGVAKKAGILPGLSNYHLKTVSVELVSVAALDHDVCLVRTKVHATHDWKGKPLPGNLIASTIWQMISGRWQMVFHQETVAS